MLIEEHLGKNSWSRYWIHALMMVMVDRLLHANMISLKN